jgi:hypothetical protein
MRWSIPDVTLRASLVRANTFLQLKAERITEWPRERKAQVVLEQ